MNPSLSKIRIYPIKSLDPIELSTVKIGMHCLLGDRRFAMLNQFGSFINGKATGLVNQLQTSFDDQLEYVTFNKRGSDDKIKFNLNTETNKIDSFLSLFFNNKVSLIKNDEGRFMDVPVESAVTVVAYESMKYLSNALGDSIDTLRLRFRANIEISNVPAYWEEHLANYDSENGVSFQIGDVKMIGRSLRARCNVPPRNPLTGETDKTFVKRMIASRQENIPSWSQINKLDSLYHFTVDTFIPVSEFGKEIKVGDLVQLL